MYSTAETRRDSLAHVGPLAICRGPAHTTNDHVCSSNKGTAALYIDTSARMGVGKLSQGSQVLGLREA